MYIYIPGIILCKALFTLLMRYIIYTAVTKIATKVDKVSDFYLFSIFFFTIYIPGIILNHFFTLLM